MTRDQGSQPAGPAESDQNQVNSPTVRRELLSDYTRIEPGIDGYWFEVGVVGWTHPHEPGLVWKRFRFWKSTPTPERIARAGQAALATSRFFQTCESCGELNNAGHMYRRDLCQGCAEKHLNVVW